MQFYNVYKFIIKVICTIKKGGAGYNQRKEADEISTTFGDERTGDILIPEILEDVAQITPDEERAYESITCKMDDLRPTLAPSMQNWTKSKYH